MSPCLRIFSDKLKNYRSCKSTDEESLRVRQIEHSPTIGQGRRISLRVMRLGSVASEGFDRLESQNNITPLAMQTMKASEKENGHVTQVT
jgi:hypothetical protein